MLEKWYDDYSKNREYFYHKHNYEMVSYNEGAMEFIESLRERMVEAKIDEN